MSCARSLASEGVAVVVVLHDLSLAAAYADRIALIAGGSLRAVGTPADVITAPIVEEVYGLPVEILQQSGRPIVLPIRPT